MKEYEIHAVVKSLTYGDTDCYLDYVMANNKTEAKKIYKEQLKARKIRLVSADIIEA